MEYKKNIQKISVIESIFNCFDFKSCNDIFQSVFTSQQYFSEVEQMHFTYEYLLKILIIQRYYNLDSTGAYSLIHDSVGLTRFLQTQVSDVIPSPKTIDNFRCQLFADNKLYEIFQKLDIALAREGITIRRGYFKEPAIIKKPHPLSDSIPPDEYENVERISEVYHPSIEYPIKFRSDTSDLAVLREVFINREYHFDIEFTPQFIIDCGANIGLSSIYFKSRYPEAQIVAIEPEKSNFYLLEQNLSYYYPSIECLRYGVWNKNTYLSVEDEYNSGNWGFIVKESSCQNEESVKSITIDNILDKYSRNEIDILKVDIEGAELELFGSGYENWLPKTKLIFIEVHDRFRNGCSKAVFNALGNYDFSLSFNKNTIVCVNTRY